MEPAFLCPCCSGRPYEACCELYHKGKEAPTAVDLMRSRYSAYALNHVDYIIKTTYPRHPSLTQNLTVWKQEIATFSLNTDFEKLEVVDFQEKSDRATVVFIAYLKQEDFDVSFTERSFFSKIDNRWYYVNGDIYPGSNKEIKCVET